MDSLPQNSQPEKPDLTGWKKAAEIFTDFIKMTKSVDKLKKDNEKMSNEIIALRRQTDTLQGQVSILLTFVQNALDDRVEARSRKVIEQEIEKYLKK